MNNCRRSALLLFLLLFQISTIPAFNIKEMFEGMGTSFGAPPVGYTYSYEVWSDASVPVYVEQEGYASFMGAFIPRANVEAAPGVKKVDRYYQKKTLPSIFDVAGSVSKAVYHDQNYYFKMYIGANPNPHTNPIFKQSLLQLPLKKRDSKIFYYHVYTSGGFSKGNATHTPAVEMMGYQDPEQDAKSKTKGSVVFSSQLSSIMFYNSSSIDTQVTLTYGSDEYTFSLEKFSYNLLSLPTPEAKKKPNAISIDDKQSDKDDEKLSPAFSLRPNTLTFASYDTEKKVYTPFRTLVLADTGFDGCPYVMEVFQDPGKSLEVGIQGFNPGNYDVPVTSRVRDITPCPCTFWHQSFEQAGAIEGYTDLPGQIWVIYNGADSPVHMKVSPGQAAGWNLVRPLVGQGDQFVYFIYVVTTDDAVAEKFIEKVLAKTIGANILDEYQKLLDAPIEKFTEHQDLDLTRDVDKTKNINLTPEQQVAAVMGNLSVSDGVIEDKEQGVIGYIVGTDIFTPRGLGFGRYYYVLSPSIISIGNLVSLIYGCLDYSKISKLGSSDDAIQKNLSNTVQGWFANYIKKPADVQKQVEQYLIGYGNAKMVDAKAGTLTKYGNNRLESIMNGPISFKYPSMKLSTVLNQYVYDFGKSAPEKMPDILGQKEMDALNNRNTQDKQAVVLKGVMSISGADRYQTR